MIASRPTKKHIGSRVRMEYGRIKGEAARLAAFCASLLAGESERRAA